MVKLPHSVRAMAGMGEWRDALAWPLRQERRCALAEAALGALARWRALLPDGASADVADLASLHLAASGARIALHGAEIVDGLAQGIELVGTDADFAYLAGQADTPAAPRQAFDPQLRRFERVLAPLRAVRHARGWTQPSRLPLAVLSPDAHVISTSGMLLEAAAQSPLALSYWSPGALLVKAQRQQVRSHVDVGALAESWAESLLADIEVADNLRTRAGRLLVGQASAAFARADAIMAGMARLKRFPRDIWAGSAGSYATRAVGLEVLRRGGSVRRFAHGGAIGLDDYGSVHAIIEMAATSDYVATSPATHALLRNAGMDRHFRRNKPRFEAGQGDPKFRNVPARQPQRSGRPTVVYVGTAFPGALVHMPPVPPDPIYLDWQMRLLDGLTETGADVFCKPHPENPTLAGHQPLAGLYPTLDVPFSRALEMADVLVYDYCLSTSFWEAACSDRPIILLDLSAARWQPSIAAALRERCRALSVTFDERNRPQFDPRELKDAVLSPTRSADPSTFRNLLACDGHA